MTIMEIKASLKAEMITGESKSDMDITVGCAADLMSDILAYATPGALLLTGLTNPQVIRTAEMKDITAICFVRAKMPDKSVTRMAEDLNMVLLRTSLPMFESCGRLYRKGMLGLGHLDPDINGKK